MKSDIYVSINEKAQYFDEFEGKITYIIPYHLINSLDNSNIKEYYISLPHVIRNHDIGNIMKFIEDSMNKCSVKGFFVDNLEGLQLLKDAGNKKFVIVGPGLYIWNNSSKNYMLKTADKFIYPYELSKYEINEVYSEKGILNIYGKTPLMVSANCIRNTLDKCYKSTESEFGILKDRKNMDLPVLFQCKSCYNVIYNAVPTSLHEFIGESIDVDGNFMISFSNESRSLAKSIVDYYLNAFEGKKSNFSIKDFTKAYYNRGVE